MDKPKIEPAHDADGNSWLQPWVAITRHCGRVVKATDLKSVPEMGPGSNPGDDDEQQSQRLCASRFADACSCSPLLCKRPFVRRHGPLGEGHCAVFAFARWLHC